jgi:hypothetical protein
MILDVHPGSGFFPPSQILDPYPGVKKHRIPDPQHCFPCTRFLLHLNKVPEAQVWVESQHPDPG